MTILWIVWLVFRLCSGLRFKSTPFKISLADITCNGKLLGVLFGSVRGEVGFESFLGLLRTRTLPFKHRFNTLVQFFDEEQKAQLKLLVDHINLNFKRGDLLLNFRNTSLDEFATRLRQMETYPKLRSLHHNTWQETLQVLQDGRWDMIVNLMGSSSALLSTRELCSAISAKQVFPTNNLNIWRIVDGECLRGLHTDGQMIKFIRKLLVPQRIDFREMGGVGPIVRLLQLAVAVEYLGVLCSVGLFGSSYPILNSSVRRVTAEFQNALAYSKNSIDKQDIELMSIYQHMFENLQKIVEDPREPFGSDNGLRILLHRLWKMPSSFDTSTAIISVLSMMASIPEVDKDFIRASLKILFTTVSGDYIPRRSLYTLMVILAMRNESKLTSTTFLIWKYLQIGSDSLETILGINLSCFGPLASLALHDDPDGLKLFIRKDIIKRIRENDIKRLEEILRVENPARALSIDSSESVLSNIHYIMTKYFLVSGIIEETPVYLPKIQLHPFIEYGFWQLIQLAFVHRLDLSHFMLHPAYLRYIFGPSHDKVGPVKDLVETIVQEQFYSEARDKDDVAGWVSELDRLQITQSSCSQIIGTSPHDFLVYRELTRRPERTSIYERWVRLVGEGVQERFRPNLEFFGSCVWTQRQGVGWFTELFLRMSSVQDIHRIIFE